MNMVETVIGALERRRVADGSGPLLTWYGADQRVELSTATLANWVDKTVNLLVSMGFDEEPSVALPLLHAHPGHWTSMVWVLAVWQAGGAIVVGPRHEVDEVDLAVVGPESPHPVPGIETIACSLHPWGQGFDHPVPGVTDYHEVLSQPDVHWTSPTPLTHVWWRDDAREVLGTDVNATAGVAQRFLVAPTDPWATVLNAVVAPILGGGSVVLAPADMPASALAQVAIQERAILKR